MTRLTRNHWPLLITIPHGSTHIPADIRKTMNLTDHDINDYADLFTERLFDIPRTYQVAGAISRLVVDLNRAPDHLVAQAELSYEGVVASITDHGKPIFKNPPALKDIRRWIQTYHHPFHKKIRQFLPHARFLIDGHSMHPFGPQHKPDAGKPRADIVLGNREYATCTLTTTNFIRHFFRRKGYSVKVNDPYAGKYILGSHASRHGVPGIQIEVNKALYLHMTTLTPKTGMIETINGHLTELTEAILKEHLHIL